MLSDLSQVFLDFVSHPLILANLLQTLFQHIFSLAQQKVSFTNKAILATLNIDQKEAHIQKFMQNLY